MSVALTNGWPAVSRRPSFDALRDLVVLAGSIRAGSFAARVGRALFELPVTDQLRVLDLWHRQATDLAEAFALTRMTMRVMVDRASKTGQHPAVSSSVPVKIEQDPFEYRGTGGVLRDAAAGYEDSDYLFVVNAAQLPLEPVPALAEAMAATGGDVCLIAHDDGTPSGAFIIRCGVLRQLPAAGFIDMKEQALPIFAQRHRVTVVRRRGPTAIPIRTLSDYCAALRRYHQQSAGRRASADPFAEDWEPAFAVVEDGAIVAPSARLHDSVVLEGGRVGANAVLVRSLVCGGGTVAAGQVVVDQLVAPAADRARGR